MSSWLFRIAAVVAIVLLFAYELLGGPLVLPPLISSDLPEEVVWLHHFSWHVGSIAIIAMAALFLLASRQPDHFAMAVVATAMSLGFAFLGVGLAVLASGSLWGTPAPYAWIGPAVLGIAGLAIRWRSRGSS